MLTNSEQRLLVSNDIVVLHWWLGLLSVGLLLLCTLGICRIWLLLLNGATWDSDLWLVVRLGLLCSVTSLWLAHDCCWLLHIHDSCLLRALGLTLSQVTAVAHSTLSGAH